MEKCKTCTLINVCDHDLSLGEKCGAASIVINGEAICKADYLKMIIRIAIEAKRSENNE